jgi:nucleoside-diphosphate-sugar epimerase
MNGKALPITGDGSETRDWTFVDDIVSGLLAMGIRQKAVGEAINLGSGVEHQVIELANIVNSLTKNQAGVKYVARRNWDVKTHLRSSIGKARRLLGYNPGTRFEEGLRKVHEWFVANWSNINQSAEF